MVVNITGGTGFTVSPSSITFTTGNWNDAVTVNVDAPQDANISSETATITHSADSSSATEYTSVSDVDLDVTAVDDDFEVKLFRNLDPLATTEGLSMPYRVIRDRASPAPLVVNVAIEAEGLLFVGEAQRQVTIPANGNQVNFQVETETGKVIGAGGTLTVSLASSDTAPESGAGYLIDSTNYSDTRTLLDGDSPSDAQWEITLVDDVLTEGESTTVTVSITNGYVFSTDQTVKIRWAGVDLPFPLELRNAATIDTMTLQAMSSSVSATLAYDDDQIRDVYATGTVGTATAPLSARVGTDDVDEVNLTLEDDEGVPQVTVSLPESIEEGEDISLTATISPTAGYGVSIPFSAGDPDNAISASPFSSVVILAAGASTDTSTWTTLEDLLDTDPPDTRTVSITISDASVASFITNPEDAVNLVGGPRTFEVQVLDDDVRPSAPIDLTGTAGDTILTTAWTTPAAGTSDITGYEYRFSTDGGLIWNPDWSYIPNSGDTTTGYVVTGLSNENDHVYEVRAVSAAGKGYVSRVFSGAFFIPVYEAQAAPSRFGGAYFFDWDAWLVSGSEDDLNKFWLRWRTPEWRLTHEEGYGSSNFHGYEIQERKRWQGSEWSEWEELLGPEENDRYTETPIGNPYADWWVINGRFHGVERLEDCEGKEWRMRALYQDPNRRSGWVTADYERFAEAKPPPRPTINKHRQSFTETSDDAYSVSFRWEKKEAKCLANLEYEVQRRLSLGKYNGTWPPADGAELSTGVVYDSETMYFEYGRVWTNWEEAVSYQAADNPGLRHAFDFTGTNNYQLRVRARNAHGWSRWSGDWLFSFGMRGRWAAYTTDLQ